MFRHESSLDALGVWRSITASAALVRVAWVSVRRRHHRRFRRRCGYTKRSCHSVFHQTLLSRHAMRGQPLRDLPSSHCNLRHCGGMWLRHADVTRRIIPCSAMMRCMVQQTTISVTGHYVSRILGEACRLRGKARQLPRGDVRRRIESAADELESIVHRIRRERDPMNGHVSTGARHA